MPKKPESAAGTVTTKTNSKQHTLASDAFSPPYSAHDPNNLQMQTVLF